MPVPKPTTRSFKDLEGKRFGRLVATEYLGSTNGKTVWLCRCDCGKSAPVKAVYLTSGGTTSCGCYRAERTRERSRRLFTKHNAIDTSEYHAWGSMKKRCLNPDLPCYPRYGGRGIRVCERYIDSFKAFIGDIGPKPSPSHSLDRRDNDKHYSCGKCPECEREGWEYNVRWATPSQQQNNRRVTPFYTLDGVTLSLVDWAARTGIHWGTLRARIRRGWPVERAFTESVQPRSR